LAFVTAAILAATTPAVANPYTNTAPGTAAIREGSVEGSFELWSPRATEFLNDRYSGGE
jgi:hypothetical protein